MSDSNNSLMVRLQTLDSGWETVGADRLRGVVAENFQGSSNAWGSDRCSFQLRRDPGAIQPDLSAFTPCRVFVGGVRVWSGRVKETPAQDGAEPTISVAGEGMQYHLDDDVYDRIYLHSRISEYTDVRSFPLADLTRWTANGVVTTGGTATMGWSNGTVLPQSNCVGVVFDLGPTNTAVEFGIESEALNTPVGTYNFLVRTASSIDQLLITGGQFSTGLTRSHPASPAAFSDSGSFATAYRYVCCFLIRTGAATTLTTDILWRVNAIRIVTDGTYLTAGVSSLTADKVVKDALLRSTIKFSSDQSQISPGTFIVPEFALSGAQTAREVITGINAYENFETKIDVWDRACFRPRTVDPIYEIGTWSGAELSDASTNSGDEIYNRVLVQATGPDGQPLSVSRSAGGLSLVAPVYEALPSTFLPNGGFDVNTTGWTASLGTLSRTTTAAEFDTGPGALKITPDGATSKFILTATLTGTFQAGTTYIAQMRLSTANNAAVSLPTVTFGDRTISFANDLVLGSFLSIPFVSVSISWAPQTDSTASLTFIGLGGPITAALFIDNVFLFKSTPTLVDRRGFTRTKILPVSSGITTSVGNQIGDLYLKSHRTIPFRGSFQVVGQGGVRRVIGGGTVHPAWMLTDTGQLVRCVDRVDPDTGAWGRTGTIASVNYDHNSLTSSISLDDDRGGFETMLSRYSIVVGQGPKP